MQKDFHYDIIYALAKEKDYGQVLFLEFIRDARKCDNTFRLSHPSSNRLK